MDANNLCSECGKPQASNTLLGLCPGCMMKAGLASADCPTIKVAADAFVESLETETKEFTLGTKLGYFGDYELLEEIARGGMGVVYKARQASLKRIVAVKMIRSGALADETEVARFRIEAQAAAQLQHPNIVAIHEIGDHEGGQYFSLDFVEGKNLAQIADGRPVMPRKAAEWLKVIAAAVQFAHQHGVVHRDLKPQNIMVDAAGRPRVTDFGLAKSLADDSTLTRTGVVMGSPSYMSPEQARGRNDQVGPASDIYSLGAILYELLTGRPPFRSKTLLETLSEVVNEEPRPPRSWNPGAPVDLETICLKCLEKEPGRRYAAARDLELDLGRFLAGEPVQAQAASALRKTISWSQRHRWVFSAAASMLILALMGIAYGLWEQTRYLIWLNGHPGHAPDWSSRDAELGQLIVRGWLWSVLFYPLVKLGYRKLATAAPWKNIFQPMHHPAPTWVALTFGAFAAAGIVGVLYLATKVVAANVWEGFGLFTNRGIIVGIIRFGLVYPLFALWFMMLTRIIRQQRRIPVGPGPHGEKDALTPEQLDAIGAALSGGNIRKAAKCYQAATQAGFSEAQTRVLEMAGRRLSGEQIAEIEQELRAGRTDEAAKIYHAATLVPDYFAHIAVMKMWWELYRSHPEKCFGGTVDRIHLANRMGAQRLWPGIGLVLAVGLWLFPHVGFVRVLFWLTLGIVCGAILRLCGWKQALHGVRPSIKVAAWAVLGTIGLSFLLVLGLAIIRGGSELLGVFIHPATWKVPQSGHAPALAPGLAIGWLLTHLSLRRKRNSRQSD